MYESDEEFWADGEISDSEADCEILDAVRSQFALFCVTIAHRNIFFRTDGLAARVTRLTAH